MGPHKPGIHVRRQSLVASHRAYLARVSTATLTFTWTQDDPVPVYWSPTFTRTQWFQLCVTDHTGSRFTRWYHVNEVWRSAEYSVRPPIGLPEGEAWFWVRGWDPLYADTGDDVGLTGWTLAGNFTKATIRSTRERKLSRA